MSPRSRPVPRSFVRTLLTAMAAMAAMAVMAPAAAAATPCYAPPVEAPVVDPFRMPACDFCPGNRGIEYGPRPGQSVRSLAAGTVEFAGVVAGTSWLVVRQNDGLRASYGRLATMSLSRGDSVRVGQAVGTTTDRFYVGLRNGDDRPVDPTPRLGRWRHRTRLVPVDRARPRAAGSTRLVCPIARGGR